jgi:Glycosyl transferase family 2
MVAPSRLAPVCLFVFARPDHTRRTLDKLLANDLASETDIIVFSDGPRNDGDKDNVRRTRLVVKSVSGFRSIQLIEHEENYGLAQNIVQGISDVLDVHERVIVLEDDVITSPNFLRFMNVALDRYRLNPEVWHINGWNYPMNVKGLPDTYFWRLMHCWGWATWQDRWSKYDKNPKRLIDTWTDEDIKAFNLDGTYDFWSQVIANESGDKKTWAVFWYATIFENQGLCLSPSSALTQNIGLDGSGENCTSSIAYQASYAKNYKWTWPLKIAEMKTATLRAKKFNHNISQVTWRKLKLYFLSGINRLRSKR